jgi:ketosteroid isomerase-like protein
MMQWLENWDEYQAEVERFIDCGDDVLVVARERGRGKISGASVTSRNYMVFTIRAGKIARFREFYDEQAALKAVRLSEWAMSEENVDCAYRFAHRHRCVLGRDHRVDRARALATAQGERHRKGSERFVAVGLSEYAMSQANVEMIRSVLPGPDADLVAVFNDDSASGELMQTMARLLDPDFVSVKRSPGAEPEIAHGLDGLRAGWLDWLAPWASYRTEIEEMIDLGGRVVSVICDYGRCEPDAQEVALKSAVVWTVRDGRIVRAEFYVGGRDEALKAAGLKG